MDALSKTEMDRLVELAHAGAVQAGEAFAQLVGHDVTIAEPSIIEGPGDVPVPAESSSTGVFFEFDGCLDAIVGILFPGDASELLVRRIVGLEADLLEAPVIESALMEVGNILASHVASAIADRLGARLLPSIPSLAMSCAESELEAFIDPAVDHDAPRIESRLLGESGQLIGCLVLVPTA